jgi:hypothetical protein
MRALIALLAAPLLFGQEGKYQTKLGTETIEALGGVIYRHGDGRADQAMGVRLLGGLNRWMSLYGEFGYTRVISETIYQPVKIEAQGSLMDIGGGGELHLSGARVQPYILAGIGTVRISGKVAVAFLKATESEYRFASSVGGGVRIFAMPNVGFSAEVKTVTINEGRRFERYALGVFYQRRQPKW